MTRVISPLLRGSAIRLALACALAVATIGASIGLLSTSGYLISRAALQPAILDLSVVIVGVRFFALARAGSRYAERLASHDVALRLLVELRAQLWNRLEPLLPGALSADGDLLQRLVGDVEAMQDLVLRVVTPPVVAVAALPLALLVVAPLGTGTQVAVATAFLGAAVLLPASGYALAAPAARRHADAQGRLAARLLEVVDAGPELAVLGARSVAVSAIAAAEAAVESEALRLGLVESVLGACVTALTGVAVVGCLVGGAAAVAGRPASGPLLAAGALAALAVFEAAQLMPAASVRLATVRAGANRLDRLPSPRPATGTLAGGSGVIRIENAWFRYAPELPWILRGAELELWPGERVGLVGPSGSGKTTMALLLAGFLVPDRGGVSQAGFALSAVEPRKLRPRICLCAQDAHVFNTTVRANVLVARPAASEREIVETLRRVQLGDWADALETPVGENGGLLSAGQRQRLAVARALVADAEVILLDEPTANLDPATAQALMADLLDALAGRTVLLVTHRPEGLEEMDRIVELRDGRVRAPDVA